jgi:trehalose/maltose hydrolase-like predicted phosphorylase
VSPRERETWDHLSRRLRVPFHDDGVISQFDGYEKLAEFGWDAYRARYGDISRLDLILEAEGDSPNRYRLSKQADVLMLFYLFSAEEIRAILGRLGYEFPPAAIPRTIAFYLARTSHGSTLSRLVQAWVLARSDRHGSWSLLARTLDSDLADVQGGTTREGVHLGAMAGSADLVLRCYSGLDVSGGALRLNPVLPPELAHLRFDIVYRGQPITVRMNSHRVQLRLHAGTAAPIRVRIGDQTRTLRPGDEWSAPINGRAPRSQQGPSPVVSPCPHLSPAERPS